MIFGSYPCCNGHLTLSMPDKTPAYFPENCPHCDAKVWHRLSRVQSTSWTEADFLAEHEMDFDNHKIRAKPGAEAARFDELQRMRLPQT